MLCPEFIQYVTQFDICLLQETHLFPEEHESLIIPEGYEILSWPRRYTELFRKQFGGVAALIKSCLKVKFNKALSSPDIMVLELNDLIVINAYLLPENQTWEPFTDVSPFDCLRELLTALAESDRSVIIMGDLNARTGARGLLPRNSYDLSVSTRGRALLRICSELDLAILNGVDKFKESSKFTSYQPRGMAVVDYAITNVMLVPQITKFEVSDPLLEWADHAPLVLNTTCASVVMDQPAERMSRKRKLELFDSNKDLDVLQKEILDATLSKEARLARLYGRACSQSNPIEVYTAGYHENRPVSGDVAGAGVYWGNNSSRNISCRVPGRQTKYRADLLAIRNALELGPPRATLQIYTCSKQSIRSLYDLAPTLASRSWNAENGDLLRQCADLIKQRQGAIKFIQLRDLSKNKHAEAAYNLARLGADLIAEVDVLSKPLRAENSNNTEMDSLEQDMGAKIEAVMLSDAENPRENTSTIPDSPLASHRDRSKLQAVKAALREKLLGAETEASFWTAAKEIMNGKDSTYPVTADQLKEVFEKRMNPMSPTPQSFDADLLKLNCSLANAIPDRTQDTTPERFFSRPFTVDEVAAAKVRLEERKDSAKGIDRIGYREILEIED
ncbi:hypothetical protein CVT26_007405, partial [Gymnopilus dilepis]